MSDLPVACTLDPDTLKTRREGLLAQLAEVALRCDPRQNGLQMEFRASSDTLALISKVIDAERRCCRFLQFQLTVAPDEGPIILELTGPANTREFLQALIETQNSEFRTQNPVHSSEF